ncbi:hypothetical protein Tco_1372742 [Tanacetum coccineum]
MSIYLKNMAGYKHNQLKSKSYDKIQKLFDKEMKRVNNFVDMNLEVVKGSETRTEESLKISGDELASDKSKKQKIDEHVGAEKDNDPEEEEMKKHMEVVQDEEEIAIDAIPLAIKPPMIIEYKIGIDREDLETLWKLVKEKHGINRPVDEYERVVGAAVLIGLTVLIDAAALGELCLAALTGTFPDFFATAVGIKFLLGCG